LAREHRLTRRLAWLVKAGAVEHEERRLAGVLSGVLYAIGGITVPLLTVLPGVSHAHPLPILAVGAVTLLWAACSLVLIDWDHAPRWVLHASVSAGVLLIALVIASSGESQSPGWIYLFFVSVFAAYFFPRSVAFLYLIGCVAVHALPLIYDARAPHDSFLAQFVIASSSYLVLGGAIVAGKRRMWWLRRQSERLAEQQGALRRVATAVVGGEPAERIYEIVAHEAAELLHGNAAGILRLTSPKRAVIIGSWSAEPGGRYESGTQFVVKSGSDVERAINSNTPVTAELKDADSALGRLGYRSSVVAAIHVAGTVWGVLIVADDARAAFGAEDEQRLREFANLLAAAIVNLEDRAKLATQAASDPLTGLANHRALQQRLAAEAARSHRHGRTLSVAVIDIDHFKQLNDSVGHDAGDEMLVRVARCLSGLARAEDTLARIGGDEFAWVLPDTTREQALVAVERARRAIAIEMADPYGITVSAGICDTRASGDPSELIRLADGALYWSKAHGRDQSWIYDPTVIDELSAQERAERLERSRALVGLRALARAIDAKDPATSRHSERVSELAEKLARTVGWPSDRARLLGEAALVHDVGKIGVPDNLLRKAGPLNGPEREQLRAHAELAARIVEDVLSPEQVEWIRAHHERPDGHGYPLGLKGHEIPEGAALLAAADAFDAMTVSRPYGALKELDQALAECVSLVGRQFSKTAVAALVSLHDAGELQRQTAAGAYAGAHGLLDRAGSGPDRRQGRA
jgi:diguanylate cyclase (GGDEF)-like protein